MPGLHTIRADAADPRAIDALHAEVITRFSTLDVLVNNAGIMRKINLLAEQPLEELTREVGINLEAPIHIWCSASFPTCCTVRRR